MDTVFKTCARCKAEKPLSDFYTRSGYDRSDRNPSHYNSFCKDCVKVSGAKNKRLPVLRPRAMTETLAIDYLHSKGVPTSPGKAVGFADVDIVSFGCVPIEVKYARLDYQRGKKRFKWGATEKQRERGFLADFALLICDWMEDDNDHLTYHVFPSDHPVFFMGNRLKSAFLWTPGNKKALKHGNNRVVMVDGLMKSAEDNVMLIWQRLREISKEVADGNLDYQQFGRAIRANTTAQKTKIKKLLGAE